MAGAFDKSYLQAGTPKGGLGVIANFLLTLPFYKHIFAWMGGHPIGAIMAQPNFLHKVMQIVLANTDMLFLGACLRYTQHT